MDDYYCLYRKEKTVPWVNDKNDRVDKIHQKKYCQYCGRRLRVFENKKFCGNLNCINRYEDV